MSVAVRPARFGELPEVVAVIGAAFGGLAEGEAGAQEGAAVGQIWRELDRSGLVRASLVAVERGRIVGHVGLSDAWLDARERLVDVLVLSPLSVRPAAQGRGVGRALVRAAFDAAAALGSPAVFVEGDPARYAAFGFDPGAAHGIDAPSRRIPDAAFRVRVLKEGLPPGRLVYPDVWWRHDAVGLRDPLLSTLEGAAAPPSPTSDATSEPGTAPAFAVTPVAVMRCPLREKADAPIQGAFHPESEGRVEVRPEFVAGLDDIEGFSHLILISVLDRGGPIDLRPLPLLDDERHGVFATRFPARPNRLGLSVVTLLSRDGAVLHVGNVDCLDGTPIVDIKPYVRRFDSVPDAREGWFAGRGDRPKPPGRE